MTNSSEANRGTSIEVLGFCNLNMLKFIDAKIPANIWPAKIRICGMNKNGHADAKLMYIDIDGTDAEAVSDFLESNTELTLTEIDCEIDIMRLLAEAGQLEVTLPNTAQLTKNHKLSVQD